MGQVLRPPSHPYTLKPMIKDDKEDGARSLAGADKDRIWRTDKDTQIESRILISSSKLKEIFSYYHKWITVIDQRYHLSWSHNKSTIKKHGLDPEETQKLVNKFYHKSTSEPNVCTP